MKRLFLRLLPERAAAQLAVIVVGSLILANMVTGIVLLVTLPREFKQMPNLPYIVELITVARQMEAASTPEARRTVFDTAMAANPRLTRLGSDTVIVDGPLTQLDQSMRARIQEDLGDIAEVVVVDDEGRFGPPPIGLRLRDGSGLVMLPPGLPPPRGRAFIVYLIVMLALLATLIGLLSLWATRAVVSPLTRLAEAADRFDPDRDEVVAIERGPVEIKRLAAAYGAMAGRIRRLIDERTRMLAAVSHDLRTPITRLRLRAEDIGEEDNRQAILSDLALMERMVGGALSYLREGRASGSMVAADIPALLQTICDDFGDLGHVIVYQGPMRASAVCDSDQMMRAVTNLIDNAIKFGGKVTLRLDDHDADMIAIVVEDDGPGIAAEEREKVFEPFYRSDLARTLREGSGFGLGLAIVCAIAKGHRGDLTLTERPGGGLRATIAWPRRW